MKKWIALLLCAALLLSFPAAASAAETADAVVPAETPQLHITTAGGNGVSLEKEDGYTDAVFSADGGAELPVVVKVRGNSTAMTAKKSFTFKFEKKQNLYGMGSGKKWVLLANPFDPTLLRNYIAFDLAQKLGLAYTSNQRIVELWLDGSFRGCYTLMEPVQEGRDRVDIDCDSGDFLVEYERSRTDDGTTYVTAGGLRFGISEPDEPTEEQTAAIQDALSRVGSVLGSGDREEIERLIDVPSFAKFYVLNEFLKTNDFNFSSVYFYQKNGRLYAGPPWDYDLSMGNVNREFSSNSANAFKTDGLFITDKLFYKKLCGYDWFMAQARREYALVADDIAALYPDGGTIDALAEAYADVFSRNYNEAGWKIRYLINVMMQPLPTYEENLAYLKSWCAERDAWLSAEFDIDALRYLIGDSDGNGVIDVTDVTLLQTVLAEAAPDPDGRIAERGGAAEGQLSISDATAIQKYLAELPADKPIGHTGVLSCR